MTKLATELSALVKGVEVSDIGHAVRISPKGEKASRRLANGGMARILRRLLAHCAAARKGTVINRRIDGDWFEFGWHPHQPSHCSPVTGVQQFRRSGGRVITTRIVGSLVP